MRHREVPVLTHLSGFLASIPPACIALETPRPRPCPSTVHQSSFCRLRLPERPPPLLCCVQVSPCDPELAVLNMLIAIAGRYFGQQER